MSKFLLNLLLQISKAMVNSKIQFLIQKFFFLLSARPTPRPLWPLAQPAHRLRRLRRPKSSRLAHPTRASVTSSRKIRFSLSDHAFLSRPPLPRLSVDRAPPARFPPFPASADPGRKSPVPPLPCAVAPRLGCPELLQPSVITLLP
jgi:hypothetical protein